MNPELLEALRAEVVAHTDLVRSRLRQWVPRHDVEDVLQEVLLHAIKALSAVREPAAIRSWLLVIAKGKSVDHLRKQYRESQVVPLQHEVVDPRAVPGVAEAVASAEAWQAAMHCMQQLPVELQQPARAYWVHGESLAMIAKALGRSKSVIQKMITRAKHLLAEQLTQAGHAAVVPMLDIVAPWAGESGLAGAAVVRAGRGASWSAAVGAGFVLAVAAWWWIAAADVASGGTTQASQASSADHAMAVLASAPVTSAASDLVRETVGEPVIHGRIVDGASGEPIAGAVVHTFDYLYRRNLELVVSDEDGMFCVEATRGARRPFDVRVVPPDAKAHGRVRLGAILPAAAARSVPMVPPVDVRLTVMTDWEGKVPLRDIEVTVVDMSCVDSWPLEFGRELCGLLPPEYTIVARTKVVGPAVDVLLRNLPRVDLAAFLSDDSGVTWMMSSDHFSINDILADRVGEAADRRILAFDDMFSCVSFHAMGLLRNNLCGTKNVSSIMAVPGRMLHTRDLVNAYCEGLRIGSVDDTISEKFHFHGVAGLCGFPPVAREPSESQLTRNVLRISSAFLGRVNLPPDGRESVVVLARQCLDGPALLGYAYGKESIAFSDVPVGLPLQLSIYSRDLDRICHQSLVYLGEIARGEVDLDQELRIIDIVTSHDSEPLAGCQAAVRFRTATDRENVRQFGLDALEGKETDASGRTTLMVVGLEQPEVEVKADVAGGTTTVHATSLGAGATPGTFSLELDFGVGFDINVHAGGRATQSLVGRSIRIEGEVVGAQRIAFRQVIEVCDSNVMRVFPGMAGQVRARLCVGLEAADSANWSSIYPLEAISGRFDDKSAVWLDLAGLGEQSVPVAIHIVTAEGKALLDAGVTVEIEARQRLAADQRALEEARPWQDLPCHLAGGFAYCQLPTADAVELRILVAGYAPTVVTVPERALAEAGPITVVVAAVREVVIGPGLDRYGVDPSGNYARGLRMGDRIVAVGGTQVASRSDVAQALEPLPSEQPVVLRLLRAGAERDLTVLPPWRPFLKWVTDDCLVER